MQYIAMKRNNGFFLLQCTMKGELVMNQEIASKIEQLNKIVGDISKNCNCIIKRNQQIEKEYLGDSMGRFLGKTATALAAAGASKAIVNKMNELAALATKNAVMEASMSVPTVTETLALPGPLATGAGTVIEMGGPIAESTALTTTGSTALATTGSTALATTGAAETATGLVEISAGLSTGALAAVALSTIAGFAAGWNIGNKFITPLRLCYHEQKTLKNQAEKLVKNCGTLMSALLQCRARVKNANSDLQSALKKLETEEYKGLEKRRKKIKKRIKELNALEQEIASMNKAISSVYAVTKKWLN